MEYRNYFKTGLLFSEGASLKSLAVAVCAVGILSSCGGKSEEPNPTPTPTPTPTPEKLQIKISPNMTRGTDSGTRGTEAGTRATDFGFETGDETGLFVVNYADGKPGALAANGNHVSNMRFRYNGEWTPDSPIFWVDNETHADFYLYYPYTSDVQNVTAMPFAVMADQSREDNYKRSDLMVGKTLNVSPSSSATVIPVDHVMSRIVITLEAGNGFTQESLAEANVQVSVNGVKCNSTVDIATGGVSATGDVATVTPLYADNSYKALIVPQTVEEGNLITVNVDGRDFNLRKGFTFESTKSHRFTVTLSKTSNGVNVNINPWNDDGTDNGGTAE